MIQEIDEKERTRQKRAGTIGEMIFSNYMSAQGKIIQHSIDPHDSSKDLTIDGKKYEVKAQVPFIIEDAFTIRKHQIKKCSNADYVVFLSIPTAKREHFSSGKVYIIEGLNIKELKNRITFEDKRKMYLIPIALTTELFTMNKEECALLQKYSSSGWNA